MKSIAYPALVSPVFSSTASFFFFFIFVFFHFFRNQTEDGRVPHTIKTATCKKCSIEGMDSEPIKIQIYVYRMTAAGTPDHWCRCPYDIAVGCTCVRREQSS